MRVKGLVALLTAVLSISVMPQVAQAADSPSFEIKSVSATAIDPGETVTWKIQVNLIPGWVKYLSLSLRTPNGDLRAISALVDPKYQINVATSKEVILDLKTNSYDLAGKYRIVFGYIANAKEYYAYDPINGKEYAGKGYMVAQNMSQFDFTIRDSGTGVQKTPQMIESVGFTKSQVDPGSSSVLQVKTSGTGVLVSVNVQLSTPDGTISAYCDATMQDQVSYCKDLLNNNGRYSFSIPIWTAEDSSPGNYKISQVNIGYRNGNGQQFTNDTASWGGNVVYEDTENSYNGVKPQKLSQFPQSSLAFTLLDAGQGIAQTPIWTGISWKTKSVKAGSIATLVISVDGFKRNIGSISIPIMKNLGGKGEVVYTNQSNTQVVRQIKPNASNSIFPITKSGSFEIDINIPRTANPGEYVIGQMVILGTTCNLLDSTSIYSANPTNNLNCQSSPNGWRTNYYLGSLTKDFGSSSISAKAWSNYVNPQTIPLEVTAPDPFEAPKIEIADVNPSTIDFRYEYSSESSCIATSSAGNVVDDKNLKDKFWYFQVNNLTPDTAVTIKLTCSDATGAKAESIANTRTAKPIAPASPKLTLDSTTTSTATFSIGIREGFKYSVMADSGQAIIQGSKVEVSGLKPGVKTFIVATITDSYGQSTSAEPFYFAAALPEKPAKPSLTPGKVTTTRVEFKYEKLPNLDYELTVSEGEVVDIRGSVSVSRLAPNTKITASLKVIDEFGQSSTSDTLVLKSAIPELPAMPVLYLAKATSESITLRFTPRAGLNYAIKATAGTGSISNGSIVITGLKPTQKVAVSLVMTDIYGQYKSSDFYTFATTASAKAAAKTSITCVKGKTSKVITAVKPTCPTGYIKK
ncbi:MAG: hypothetical protein K9F92_00305 [Candidatus Nanopelagicaceae bacterium]|nr:hypothetical protein [Candidatus Nanopelagicaceae bacterium]